MVTELSFKTGRGRHSLAGHTTYFVAGPKKRGQFHFVHWMVLEIFSLLQNPEHAVH